jgi:hypothetical protein
VPQTWRLAAAAASCQSGGWAGDGAVVICE